MNIALQYYYNNFVYLISFDLFGVQTSYMYIIMVQALLSLELGGAV